MPGLARTLGGMASQRTGERVELEGTTTAPIELPARAGSGCQMHFSVPAHEHDRLQAGATMMGKQLHQAFSGPPFNPLRVELGRPA